MDAGGKVGDIAGGTAGLLASGLKDNVQLFDSVSRSTVGNVGKALGSALHEAKTPADVAQEAAAAEAAARHAASQLELLKSFEQWLDELGGGAQLEALEKLRDGCHVRVQLKLAKLGGSQRDAFGHNFAELRRLLGSEDDGDGGSPNPNP